MEINGKKYELIEGYVIPESEVETVDYGYSWGDQDTYEVNLARRDMKVQKCFVLVEVAKRYEDE